MHTALIIGGIVIGVVVLVGLTVFITASVIVGALAMAVMKGIGY